MKNLKRKIMNQSGLFLLLCMFSGCLYPALAQSEGVWDVFRFGAKGDGTTLDTRAIQAAIDQCHNEGGGKVYLHNGQFISGTIILKSHVTLYVEAGAILRASSNLDDFPIMPSKYPSYTGDMLTNKMLIYAEDARNISICGRGTIDGRGDDFIKGPYLRPSFSGRPRIIHMRGCEDIAIRDITLYNSASWVQSYQSCNKMIISGITVDSRENKDIEKPRHADAPGRNCDGLDLVDCNFVRVSDCLINSGDDAICLKSFSPGESCSNITITNCIVSSNASGIKIGTETAGIIEDITIQNCVVYDTRRDGIAIMTADGARIRRVNISNISLRNIKTSAIFIRLGTRLKPYRKNAVPAVPVLQDIVIENIQGTRISMGYGCSITGLENLPVENLILKNINLSFEGGGQIKDIDREIPENEKNYPNGEIFGVLPAYGFYIRHVRNIIMDDIQLDYTEPDHRPAIYCDDVSQLEIRNLKAMGSPQSPEVIRLNNTREVMISDSQPISRVETFVGVYGGRSENIFLRNNRIKNLTNMYRTYKAAPSVIKEFGSF